MHLTEKSSGVAAENKYVFVVSKKANKNQIKQDVENKFGVKATAINIINLPDKERIRGRISGWKPGLKKAVVKIAQGQKIEME